MYQVLLYYKYVTVEKPDFVRDEQRKLCERLNLTGRILVAREGINGTVEGSIEATNAYIEEMEKNDLFADISFKKSESEGNSFPKLRVRTRPEIVTAGMPDLNPVNVTGKYITADELHNWFEEKREFYIVDMRNDFEYASGYFDGFIPSGMKHFFELKNVLPKLAHLKGKTIVTVCTGGVRCEKASGFLVENGFKDVYQLKDGIQTYMEKYPNKHFKGKLYVFDSRITIGFNINEDEYSIVGKCESCSSKSENYVNCYDDDCHRHFILCEECIDDDGLSFCNEHCRIKYKMRKSQLQLGESA